MVLRLDPLLAEMRELAHQLGRGRRCRPSSTRFSTGRTACRSCSNRSCCRLKTASPCARSVGIGIHARLNRLPRAQGVRPGAERSGQRSRGSMLPCRCCWDKETSARLRRAERLDIVQPSIGTSIRFRHAIRRARPVPKRCRDRVECLHRAAIAAVTATYSDLGGQLERLAFHAAESAQRRSGSNISGGPGCGPGAARRAGRSASSSSERNASKGSANRQKGGSSTSC